MAAKDVGLHCYCHGFQQQLYNQRPFRRRQGSYHRHVSNPPASWREVSRFHQAVARSWRRFTAACGGTSSVSAERDRRKIGREKAFGLLLLTGRVWSCLEPQRTRKPLVVAVEKTGPQAWLTTLWRVGTGLAWAWRTGKATDAERTHLRDMLCMPPENALLIADAGFTGYDLMKEIVADASRFQFASEPMSSCCKNLAMLK